VRTGALSPPLVACEAVLVASGKREGVAPRLGSPAKPPGTARRSGEPKGKALDYPGSCMEIANARFWVFVFVFVCC
jgi:hypothetical protein